MIDPTSASSIQSMMETIRSYQSQAASSTQAGGMANSASSAQQMGMNGLGGAGANPASGAIGSTTGAFQAKNISAPTTELPNFTDSVRNLLNKVNDVNVNSEKMADAYQRGEDIPLTDVVLGMQKASLSFEATLQVRNKVLKAYEDIMNMPV